MVFLKGTGAFKDLNLVAVHYDKAVSRDKETNEIKGRALEFQLDARDAKAADQSNLNLVSKRDGKNPDGSDRHRNGTFYSAAQSNKMIEVAQQSGNVFPVNDKDGNKVGVGFGIKAEAMVGKDGLIVNTKNEIKPSDFKVDETTRANQFDHMREVGSANRAKAAEEKATKAAEAPQVEAAEAAPLGFDAVEAEAKEEAPAFGD